MNLKLNKLNIENFKGIQRFGLDVDGENAVIKAENGIGKTSVADADNWLFSDKDSSGAADFEIHPLDEIGKPLKGITTSVEEILAINGINHVIKKECKEKINKGKMVGYETFRYIDEVPYKEKDFTDYLNNIFPIDKRILTNLRYFAANEKQGGIHWTKRRALLVGFAGKIGTPKGFDELLTALNGRTIEQYKSVLNKQKEVLEIQQKEINPRIDELQRGLNDYAGTDTKVLESKRTGLTANIAKLDKERQTLFAQEKQRLAILDEICKLRDTRANREYQLNNDTSHIKGLLDEKAKIETEITTKKQAVAEVKNNIMLVEAQIKGKESQLEQYYSQLDDVRKKYTALSEFKHDTVCYACGQKLPTEKLMEAEERRIKDLNQIIKQGEELKGLVDTCKKELEFLQIKLKDSKQLLSDKSTELTVAESAKAKRFAEIDKAISNKSAPDYTKDKEWQNISDEILKAEKLIGPPASEQLQAIDSQKQLRQHELGELNIALNQVDRAKQDKARIAELEIEEKELAQKLANIQKLFADIKNYNMTLNGILEEAVNEKFKYAKFKLFEYQLNGEVIECCEVTYNGVPYGDLSYGQKIRVGMDIVNVFQKYYDSIAPVWIDNAEGLTLPIETTAQTIKLFAESGISELTVERMPTRKRKELSNV